MKTGFSFPQMTPYGTMIVIGLAVTVICAFFIFKRRQFCIDDIFILLGFLILFTFIGAKVMYLLVSAGEIDWARMIEPTYLREQMTGGFVFYGGLLGAIVAFPVAEKICHIPGKIYLNHLAGCFPLFHGFGRIGCLLAGCCYGIRYSGPGHIVYNGITYGAPTGVPLFPVQLLEAVIEFGIAFLLLWLEHYGRNHLILLYLFVYSIVRFMDEFLRGDRIRGIWGGLSTSQICSLIILIAIIMYIIIQNRHEKRETMQKN